MKISRIILFIILMTTILPGGKMPSIIPNPTEMELNNNNFALNFQTTIKFDKKNQVNAEYLSDQIFFLLNKKIQIQKIENISQNNSIYLQVNHELIKNNEGYQLEINNNQILITGKDGAGVFHGMQSLIQIIEEFSTELPGISIVDYPRYKYRGVHLDVCRHFFPADFIKKYIDMLAMHKMNKFHWHLTEDQGWRIEIKKYPKLTEIGSIRKKTLIGRARVSTEYDNTPYGGFYTQDEVREIVKYAADRHITIIPEIEMPGHSLAALAAYPELGCTSGPYEVSPTWGIFDDVYCAGNDQVFDFMENVLTEVMELFPSEYIHIGGDECPKTQWKTCPKCQLRIKDENLANEHELQSYFIRRIEKFLNSHGREIIGWDEILEGGLAPNATVMSWRGIEGGLAAARSEHDVVMTPNTYCYFDYYQALPEYEPLAIGGYLTLKKVYEFDPTPKELESKFHSYIIGGQANLWTEYIPNSNHVEYMLNPRLAALSEALWTTPEKKSWPDFQKRIIEHKKRLNNRNINYSDGSFEIDMIVNFDNSKKQAIVTLESEQPNPEIRYTLDGSTPSIKSNLYQKPIEISKMTKVKAAHFVDGVIHRGISEKLIGIHKAIGVQVKLENNPHRKYTAKGGESLVDGLTGSQNFRDGYWLGFEKNDLEALLIFDSNKKIQKVTTNYFSSYKSWIFPPKSIELLISEDGKNFKSIKSITITESNDPKEETIKSYEIKFPETNTKYLKIIAKNTAVCPKGHPGEGQSAWLFIDEIMVE